MKIIAGNFKMNKTIDECKTYVRKFSKNEMPRNRKVIICPPSYVLDIFYKALPNVSIGAQNVGKEIDGPLTGELSASMLKSVGIDYCLIGHSERRIKLGETDLDVNAKAKLLVNQKIIPIICIGETLEEITKKKTVLSRQLTMALDGVDGEFIIAYEPVWAIGTGKTCKLEDIEETHLYIKDKINKLFGKEVKVLYGGSVKPNNAKEILSSKLVDGVLVGGACLDPGEFYDIILS